MLAGQYDTRNLRNDVMFITSIFPFIEWVPFSALGKGRYTNEQMAEIIHSSPKENLGQYISNPYEVIQYLQNSNFTEAHDHDYTLYGKDKWELHKSGLHALNVNGGSCSSIAGVFQYLLQDKFERIASLCMLSNTGNGHALNYIVYDGKIYIIDLFVQMRMYSSYIPIETGKKEDFVKTKYITGGCLRMDSLGNFIKYFEKYNKKNNKEFLYFTYNSDTCPPVSIQKKTATYSCFYRNNAVLRLSTKGH